MFKNISGPPGQGRPSMRIFKVGPRVHILNFWFIFVRLGPTGFALNFLFETVTKPLLVKNISLYFEMEQT